MFSYNPFFFKISSTRIDIKKCGTIRVYVYLPTPPPFLEREIHELVFRRAAYLPLFREGDTCRECFYPFVAAVSITLLAMTVAGSISSSGFVSSGWVVLFGS